MAYYDSEPQLTAEQCAALEKGQLSVLNAHYQTIRKVLPKALDPIRFFQMIRIALENPAQQDLLRCTPESILGAVMTAAELGLELNTKMDHAYLLPGFNRNKKVYEAQFQLGYRGMIELAHRSGKILNIDSHVVREKDEFSYQYGLHQDLRHVPAKGDRGEITHVYASYTTTNGGFGFTVWSVEKLREHASRYSKSFKKGYGTWASNFEEMAKKTVLKQALRYAPISSDFPASTIGDIPDGVVRNIPARPVLKPVTPEEETNEEKAEADASDKNPSATVSTPAPASQSPATASGSGSSSRSTAPGAPSPAPRPRPVNPTAPSAPPAPGPISAQRQKNPPAYQAGVRTQTA